MKTKEERIKDILWDETTDVPVISKEENTELEFTNGSRVLFDNKRKEGYKSYELSNSKVFK